MEDILVGTLFSVISYSQDFLDGLRGPARPDPRTPLVSWVLPVTLNLLIYGSLKITW
jgi:hypothetical protein